MPLSDVQQLGLHPLFNQPAKQLTAGYRRSVSLDSLHLSTSLRINQFNDYLISIYDYSNLKCHLFDVVKNINIFSFDDHFLLLENAYRLYFGGNEEYLLKKPLLSKLSFINRDRSHLDAVGRRGRNILFVLSFPLPVTSLKDGKPATRILSRSLLLEVDPQQPTILLNHYPIPEKAASYFVDATQVVSGNKQGVYLAVFRDRISTKSKLLAFFKTGKRGQTLRFGGFAPVEMSDENVKAGWGYDYSDMYQSANGTSLFGSFTNRVIETSSGQQKIAAVSLPVQPGPNGKPDFNGRLVDVYQTANSGYLALTQNDTTCLAHTSIGLTSQQVQVANAISNPCFFGSDYVIFINNLNNLIFNKLEF